jgi:hypothetical protein
VGEVGVGEHHRPALAQRRRWNASRRQVVKNDVEVP